MGVDRPIVLLVEDNLDHARLVMRGFAKHCVANEVRHVEDGEAALDYLFRRGDYADPETSPAPTIVLLDLRLPRLDGLQVLQEIKHSPLKDIPVIILTTSSGEQDIAKAYEYRANSYLVKPIDFPELTKMIDDICSYWLAWNRYPNSTGSPVGMLSGRDC